MPGAYIPAGRILSTANCINPTRDAVSKNNTLYFPVASDCRWSQFDV